MTNRMNEQGSFGRLACIWNMKTTTMSQTVVCNNEILLYRKYTALNTLRTQVNEHVCLVCTQFRSQSENEECPTKTVRESAGSGAYCLCCLQSSKKACLLSRLDGNI